MTYLRLEMRAGVRSPSIAAATDSPSDGCLSVAPRCYCGTMIG